MTIWFFYILRYTKNDLKTIGEVCAVTNTRLRDLREDHDLRQADLAKLLNCSQVCYSYYENGQRDIPTDALVCLADFYHVSVDYILRRTDTPEMA